MFNLFDLKTAKISDYEIIQARPKDISRKVFIPFCKVRKGEEVIPRTAHEVGELPKEVYELFTQGV